MQTGLKTDNILGYRILKKIGSGGFGEVWKAEAPGGLLKAVKILYGFHDERRACDELKALDRIKQLRHPFLLSLERIEVVDKQLVVITELADGSLADLFEKYAREGRPGIPREELLQYLRQAAEAMDFLASEHGLQHLDVKPENLLLVGKHAKLADFGLVKDLRDADESLMGGLTPSFSAPELFDGRPSLQSDQYALAIVFQEMLTGKRPFNGSTLAQLAGQHMHSPPDLSPLPRYDQSVIGRALSKKPDQRYPSCRAMIDDLINERMIVRQVKRKSIPTRGSAPTSVRGNRLGSGDTCQTQFVQTAAVNIPGPDCTLVDIPAIKPARSGIGPTLIVGIGKTATGILQRLKLLVAARHHPLPELPAIRLLAIDTERPDGEGRSALGVQASLAAEEQVFLPLRRPEEYRTRSDRHKNWLNRRWIYNVPKTLQTEGLRPLGRLAMIDNFAELHEGLGNAVEQIARRDSVATTADRLGVEPLPDRPRVIVLTSISGGIGSGMTLDLCYAIRLVLEEHSLPADCLTGILLHATHSSTRDSGIAVANSFSFLTELRHYTQRGYPGEETCGLPAMANDMPFDFPYFVHLGDNTAREEWEHQLDSVAEYVYLNSLSPADAFFDGCRDREREIGHFALRSFGVAPAGLSSPDCQRQLSELVRNHLVERWRQPPHPVELTRRLQELDEAVSISAIEQSVRQRLNQVFPETSWLPLCTQIACWAMERSLPDSELATRLKALEAVLGEPPPDAKSAWSGLHDDLHEVPRQLAAPLCEAASRLAASCLEGKSLALGFASKTVEAMIGQMENQRAAFSAAIISLAARNSELQNTLKILRTKPPEKRDYQLLAVNCADELAANRLKQLEARIASEVLLHVQRRLGTHLEGLKHCASEIFGVVQSRDSELSEKAVARRFHGFNQALVAELLSGLPGILDGVETRLHTELAQPGETYWKQIQNPGFIRRYLPEAVKSAVRSELASAGKEIDIDRVLSHCLETNRFSVDEELRRLLGRAAPAIRGCGGVARLMLGVSRRGGCGRISEEVSSLAAVKPNLSMSTAGDLLLATEAEDISLATVAFRLLEARSDCLELSQRLQSRSDVKWQSLEDLL